MSCFWDGILSAIKPLMNYTHPKFHHFQTDNPHQLANSIKFYNKIVDSVTCNGELPSHSQQSENKMAIDNIDLNQINNGYFCSTFDPVLFLISDLFKVRIIHNYNGIDIVYSPIEYKKTVCFKSDHGHFWFEKSVLTQAINKNQHPTSQGSEWWMGGGNFGISKK